MKQPDLLGPSDYLIVVVIVPVDDADRMRGVMESAGAGQQGRYGGCSFSVRGTGRFRPGPGSSPAIGAEGADEQVDEEQIQMVCQADRVESVVAAIHEAHPYEETYVEVRPLFHGCVKRGF